MSPAEYSGRNEYRSTNELRWTLRRCTRRGRPQRAVPTTLNTCCPKDQLQRVGTGLVFLPTRSVMGTRCDWPFRHQSRSELCRPVWVQVPMYERALEPSALHDRFSCNKRPSNGVLSLRNKTLDSAIVGCQVP